MLLDIILYILTTVWFVIELIIKNEKTSSDKKTEGNFYKGLYSISIVTALAGIAWGDIEKYAHIDFLYIHSSVVQVVGIILLIAGGIIRLVAIRTLGQYFTINLTIQNDHKLITTGLYHYIRHPAYSGAILSIVGIGIAYTNIISFILIALPYCIFIAIRIKNEEQVMEDYFKEEYIEWKKSTKRIIPFIY